MKWEKTIFFLSFALALQLLEDLGRLFMGGSEFFFDRL